MSLRQRMFLIIWIIGIVGSAVLIAKYYPGSHEKTEQISCQKYCKTELRTDGYLKRLHTNPAPGRENQYHGP